MKSKIQMDGMSVPGGKMRYQGCLRWRQPEGCVNFRGYHDWEIDVNQGWRPAQLVAKTGRYFLFCYEMPNGKRYLSQVEVMQNGEFAPWKKSVNAHRLPAMWKPWEPEAHASVVEWE